MEISAAQVKAFRDKTGLPMMDCKRALIEAEGNEDLAVEILRKSGAKTMAGRTDRVTEAGRISLYVDTDKNITAMVELLCESAPVSKTEEFVALSNALAEQLAKGPGAKTAEELLAQPYPGKPGTTLKQVFDEQVNKIREVFRLPRLVRIEGPTGAYVHHDFAAAAVLPLEGDNSVLGKDIAMHVVAMKPEALSEGDVPPAVVERERNFVLEQAKADASFAKKPENIQQKIIDGKMKSFFAERTLLGQQFVKDSAKTVAQVAEEGKIKIKEMIHWVLGK
ncbi:MAG: translation elongation factor Ts [Planctomycetaceae bacterium]|jgi:elongation factor Ts|nr:translation elongation factor Ts [Planctomycetaceae bacterium]